jgi:hypothetical protein
MLLARSCLLVATAAIAGCAAATGPLPSLAPRTAEAIDPRLPVAGTAVAGPVDPTRKGADHARAR